MVGGVIATWDSYRWFCSAIGEPFFVLFFSAMVFSSFFFMKCCLICLKSHCGLLQCLSKTRIITLTGGTEFVHMGGPWVSSNVCLFWFFPDLKLKFPQLDLVCSPLSLTVSPRGNEPPVNLYVVRPPWAPVTLGYVRSTMGRPTVHGSRYADGRKAGWWRLAVSGEEANRCGKSLFFIS